MQRMYIIEFASILLDMILLTKVFSLPKYLLKICKDFRAFPASKYWSLGRSEDVPLQRPQDVP